MIRLASQVRNLVHEATIYGFDTSLAYETEIDCHIIEKPQTMNLLKFYKPLTFILIASFFIIQTDALAQQLWGNGKVEIQERDVSGFNGVKSSGGYNIEISLGDKESVRVEAEENILEHIRTEVENNILHIYNSRGIQTNKGLKVYVTLKKINYLKASAGVKFVGKSVINSDKLQLDISSGSKATLDLNVKNLEADLSGGSKAILSGNVITANIDASGASHVDAAELKIKNAKVDASGASKVKLYATDNLGIKASGASSVYYKGEPNISPVTSTAARVSKM